MTFKIYERKDKVSSKGTPLMFVLQPNNIKIATGIHCVTGSWNHEAQQVRTTGDNKDPRGSLINGRLRKYSVQIQDIIDRDGSITEIRQLFKKSKTDTPRDEKITITNVDYYDSLTPLGRDFYKTIERLIHSHKSDWSDGYKKRFRSVRTKLLAYEPNFKPEMLEREEWWRGFVTWCIETLENVSNTINSDTATIEALKSELEIKGPKFEWGYTEPEVMGLTWDKVMRIKDVDLTDYPKATVEDSRTHWVAAALLGRRWDEMTTITPANFYQKKGQWRYKNIGKGQKPVDIPLLPEAVPFFKKIKFTLPKIASQTVNIDIKLIGQKAGLNEEILKIIPIRTNEVKRVILPEYKTIHYHSARHSFGQHVAELAAGKPHAEKFISYMLGHASFQTSWKYMNRSASSNDLMFDEIFNSTQVV